MRKRKLKLDREVLSASNGSAELDGATGWSRQEGCTGTCINTICNITQCFSPSDFGLCSFWPCPDEIV